MSERKINLESIILEAYGCKDVNDFQKSNDVSIQMIKEICIEAIRQVIELAAENANLSISSRGGDTYFSDFYSAMDDVEVNQQSILDTIKQIEE